MFSDVRGLTLIKKHGSVYYNSKKDSFFPPFLSHLDNLCPWALVRLFAKNL